MGIPAKNAEAARKVLSERVVQEIGPIADILISRAKKGDMRAIKELLDRAWGRPQQALTPEPVEPYILNLIKYRDLDDLDNATLEKIAATGKR
jgi:hypothetical protein